MARPGRLIPLLIAALSLCPSAAEGAPDSMQDLTGRRFVRASVDPPDPYIRQQTTYTLHYYFENYPPTTENISYSFPAFPDFESQNLGSSTREVMVDGKPYYVEEIRAALFPLTEGGKNIPPARLILPSYAGRPPYTLETKPAAVSVRPLPKPVPDAFSGGVGNFKTRIRSSRDRLTMGEAARLIVTVEGRGYLKSLTNIPTPAVSSGNIHAPSVEDKWDAPQRLLGGRRIFAYPFTPSQEGYVEVELPPVHFFLPDEGRYAASPPQKVGLTVEAAAAEAEEAKNDSWRTGLLLTILGACLLGVVGWGAARLYRGRPAPAAENPLLERMRALQTGGDAQFCQELARLIRRCASSGGAAQTLRSSSSPAAKELLELLEACGAVQFAKASLSIERQREMKKRAVSVAAAYIAETKADGK
ncbi:MAG: hypothetical protein OXT69_07205 [Candidatus Poribacteria bacterium]|nr:hypothetical protein [Candidatus Poribacteria bacterium]